MWLSKMLSGGRAQTLRAERGLVTMSSGSGIEAGGAISTKNIRSYSPYGYDAIPPLGEELIIIPSTDGQVAVGTKLDVSDLQAGEIRLSSVGGAQILLKNDGTVVINSVVIDKNGVINNG